MREGLEETVTDMSPYMYEYGWDNGYKIGEAQFGMSEFALGIGVALTAVYLKDKIFGFYKKKEERISYVDEAHNGEWAEYR